MRLFEGRALFSVRSVAPTGVFLGATHNYASGLHVPGMRDLHEDAHALLGMRCTRLEGVCSFIRAPQCPRAYFSVRAPNRAFELRTPE